MRFRVWDAVTAAYWVLVENRQRLLLMILLWSLFVALIWAAAMWAPYLLGVGALPHSYPSGSRLAIWAVEMSAWLCVCIAVQRFVVLGESPVPIPKVGSLLVTYTGYLCLAILPYVALAYLISSLLPDGIPDFIHLLVWAASGCLYLTVAAPFLLPLAAVAAQKPGLSIVESYRLTRAEIVPIMLGAAACAVPPVILQFPVSELLRLFDFRMSVLLGFGVQSFFELSSYAVWLAYISFVYLHFTRRDNPA